MCNALWLQIASIEVIRQLQIEMMRVREDEYTMLVAGCAIPS